MVAIYDLANELAGLSLSRLRQVIAKYNNRLKISGHSGLGKEELIGHVLQKTNLDRNLMSKLIKEATFHKASARSRKEPPVNLFDYITERMKKEGFPKPAPAPAKAPVQVEKISPDPAPETEPESAPEPVRRPEPIEVVAEQAVAPRAVSTIEQATGLTREQFNALDPAEAFGRFLPVIAKRNLLGVNIATEDPKTGRLVSKKSALHTPVGIGIDFDKLFKFPTVKSGLKLAEKILEPTKQQIKNVKVDKFGDNLREYIFSEDKKMYLSVVQIQIAVREMINGLRKYVETGDLNEYDFYIYNEVYTVSAMAGYGYNLDIDKAIAEIHRLYPESRGATTRYTGGDYNLNAPQDHSGLHRIGIRDGDFTYILEAKPFGYPTLIKKHNDKGPHNNSVLEKRKITTVNMWKDMRKPFTYDYL